MKCLRCRNETTSNSSFCDECLKTVSVPLEPSPYLNTQINLSARKKRRAAQTASVSSAASPEDSAPNAKAWRATAIFLALLCILLAAACAWFSRDLWLGYLQ